MILLLGSMKHHEDNNGNHRIITNPDPEAALLSASNSYLDLTVQAAAATTVTTADGGDEGSSDSEENSRQRTTTSIRPSKSFSDFIPLTHPPPPPAAAAAAGVVGETKPGKNVKPPPLPRLMHPFLLKIPMQIRYVIYGTLSSALFMVIYNTAVEKFSDRYVPSTIYAAAYLIFIPIQHAMAAAMVFGWPDRYFPSLTSNVPIGLTAIALGAYLTAYLDQIKFNDDVDNMAKAMGWWKVAATAAVNAHNNNKGDGNNNNSGSKNEYYTSFFVLIVTSFWSFLLSVIVNAPAETVEKKEL